MSFLKRTLDATITLKNGKFNDGSDSVTLTGHKISCVISRPGGTSQGIMSCAIYGLSFELLNRLTNIGIQIGENIGNAIQIVAGTEDKDGKKDKSIAFEGSILQAWSDFNNQPDVMLNILAGGNIQMQLKPVGASSFQGNASIAAIMESFCKESGYTLKNVGVNGQIENAYFSGSTLEKIRSLARMARIKYTIDDSTKVVTILPIDGSITDDIPLISPTTGLVGYPTFSSGGIIVKTIYNKNIKNQKAVKLESSIPAANGTWSAYDIHHSLDSETPNGQWFTQFLATRIVGGNA
jgi:hypothetical protein